MTRNVDVRLGLLIAAILAALFLKGFALELPAVRAVNAPGEFDTARALARLARILGDERPHPVDTEANDAVRARLVAEIEAMGFAPEVRDDFTCRSAPGRARIHCARVRNVVFRAGPPGSDAVMIASHYDSVPAGPGAGDDGVGVAASLEIASLLARSPPERPVIFLITDGEEAWLLGAHSFVATDPLAREVDAVINMEARGVRGPAQMFQTSIPNGADVKAFINGAARPFANSMATDVYRLLPNDTDVTEFLPMGYDAINIALIEGVEFYHTPRDNLASLDPRSVQHMGDLALNSLRNLPAAMAEAGESQVVFTDILSRATVHLPQWLAGAALFVSMLIAAVAFYRAKGGKALRAALTAPATLVVAAGLAFGLQFLVGALRPEASYWLARPEAMQAVAYLCAAFAALGALAVVGATAGGERLVHAGWFWFAAIGAGLSFVAPGASILFALPLLFYSMGALAGMAIPSAGRLLSIAAFILALIIFAPALHLAEFALGLGTVAIFAGVAALVMMVGAPLAVGGERRAGLAPALAAGGALALAVVAALLVPAYSATKPLALNIQYYLDADAGEAKWLLSAAPGEPAPEAMARLADFGRVDIEGLAEGRLAAPAPAVDLPPAGVTILSDESDGEGRTLRVAFAPNGADIMYVAIPEAARLTGVSQSGRPAKVEATGEVIFYCLGRACDGAEFEVTLGAREPADWLVFGGRFGLPEEAAALVAARPDWTTPIQNGDVTIVRRRQSI